MSQPCDYKKPPYCNYTFTSYLARTHTPKPFADLPRTADTLYYSFSTGLLHVVALQGYCPAMKTTAQQPCLAPGSPQALWLAADLAAVNRAVTPWVVVAIHQRASPKRAPPATGLASHPHPPFLLLPPSSAFVNSNKAHSMATEGAPVQAALEALLYQYKVDVLLSGHVHAYERSCKLFNYTCNADGPVYITIGDGGNREGLAAAWATPQPAWSLFRQASFGHGALFAPNASALQWSWRQNPWLEPALTDAVWIRKGEAGQAPGTGATGRAPALRR